MAVIDVVTGAFSYSGRFVAAQLLERGRGVRTLTNHPKPEDPLASQIPTYPLNFLDPDALVAALKGADTLYNTYWVRAPHGSLTHAIAVDNTKRLIDAARRAGRAPEHERQHAEYRHEEEPGDPDRSVREHARMDSTSCA